MCASQELLLSLLKGFSVVFMCIFLSQTHPQSTSVIQQLRSKGEGQKKEQPQLFPDLFKAVKTIPEISLQGDTAITASSVSVDWFPKRNRAQWRLTLIRNWELLVPVNNCLWPLKPSLLNKCIYKLFTFTSLLQLNTQRSPAWTFVQKILGCKRIRSTFRSRWLRITLNFIQQVYSKVTQKSEITTPSLAALFIKA